MQYLIVLNDPPYGTEHSYNGLRLATPLVKGVCGSCMDARGINPGMLAEGAHRSSMAELTSWTTAADKVSVF